MKNSIRTIKCKRNSVEDRNAVGDASEYLNPQLASSSSENAEHLVIVKSIAEMLTAYHERPTQNLLLQNHTLTKGDVFKLAQLLGDEYVHGAFEEVREIKFDPTQAGSLAMSMAAHPPHIDGSFVETPPAAFVLSFIKGDKDGGGTSLFWEISELLGACPNELVTAARKAKVRFTRRRSDGSTDEFIGNLLGRDRFNRPMLRWRYDEHVRPEVLDSFGLPVQETIEWIRSYLSSTKPIAYHAQPGDTFVVRQRFYLHGRSELTSPKNGRLVLRTWIH